MAAPTVVHQELVLEIAAALRQYIKGKGGKCKVFVSPIDVQLDKDDKTMVSRIFLSYVTKVKILADVSMAHRIW